MRRLYFGKAAEEVAGLLLEGLASSRASWAWVHGVLVLVLTQKAGVLELVLVVTGEVKLVPVFAYVRAFWKGRGRFGEDPSGSG
jgi:hypothetical protein